MRSHYDNINFKFCNTEYYPENHTDLKRLLNSQQILPEEVINSTSSLLQNSDQYDFLEKNLAIEKLEKLSIFHRQYSYQRLQNYLSHKTEVNRLNYLSKIQNEQIMLVNYGSCLKQALQSSNLKNFKKNAPTHVLFVEDDIYFYEKDYQKLYQQLENLATQSMYQFSYLKLFPGLQR